MTAGGVMKEGVQYRRLSMEEREEISRYLSQKKSLRWIARQIHRSPSTVSRDVRAGGSNRLLYRASTAHWRASKNAPKRKLLKRKLKMNLRLLEEVCIRLRLRWSPEQIAESLKKEYKDCKSMQVSAETIYTYLYVQPKGRLKKELCRHLRRRRTRRSKRSFRITQSHRSNAIHDMTSIEERPEEVMGRMVPGHWEGDVLIGKNRQSALGTLVERMTRATILIPLKSKKAEEVRKAFEREALKLPEQMRLSMTYDQGNEMQQHLLFTKATRMKVYFAHLGSPWERGTNENTNGLVRDFFPKGTDLGRLSRKKIKQVQHLLNGRPRKVLNFETPYEAFKKLAGVALDS